MSLTSIVIGFHLEQNAVADLEYGIVRDGTADRFAFAADSDSSIVKGLIAVLAALFIGRPAADGWKWEPSKTSAREILVAQEILQGKQTPAFVPLPVKIQ